MTPERAVAEGALALFGEKYGDEVRVVAMGGANDDDKPFSVELCGGTHVRRTGDIGLFKIAGEAAVASGVRRIEALTGAAAEAYLAEEEDILRQAAAALAHEPRRIAERGSRASWRSVGASTANWPRRGAPWPAPEPGRQTRGRKVSARSPSTAGSSMMCPAGSSNLSPMS